MLFLSDMFPASILRRLFTFAFGLFFGAHFLCAQITLQVTSIPANSPQNAQVYVAGSFNNWNPGDTTYWLTLKNGSYWISLPLGSGTVEFKFTRGSWATVEGNANGQFRPNRTYTYGNGDTVKLSILSWEDLGGGGASTANKQVQLWQSSMFIPQLNRNRKIWVYLPQNYSDTSKRFPVLYMHDGQNVFDANTSFAGEWKVDEALVQLENEGYSSAIVVAIENGGTKRIDEYSPFVNAQYGGGEGDDYLDFIVQTLKPKVDSTFRTLTDANHTGIMGSSMGGIISHYAHFRHPDVFGRAGVFSPAFWFSNSFYTYTASKGKIGTPRIYQIAGELEAQIAKSTVDMDRLLKQEGFTAAELQTFIVAGGEHSEWFWAKEFRSAFLWLFQPANVSVNEVENPLGLKIFPNPASDMVHLEGEGKFRLRILDSNGIELYQTNFQNQTDINLKEVLSAQNIGLLFIHIDSGKKASVFKLMRGFY